MSRIEKIKKLIELIEKFKAEGNEKKRSEFYGSFAKLVGTNSVVNYNGSRQL